MGFSSVTSQGDEAVILVVMLAAAIAVVVVVVLLRVLSDRSPVREESRPRRDEGLPWTVKAYVAAYVIGSFAYWLISPSRPLSQTVLTLLVAVPLFFALLVLPIIRGSKVGWVIITLLTLLAFVALPNARSTAEMVVAVVSSLVYLGLLLHPETQRWCGVRLRRQATVTGG